jgi:ribonuclease P protein component
VGAGSRSERLPSSERLRRAAAFQAVFRRGSRAERPLVVALWMPSPGTRQAGFAAGRQIGSAVHRNRAKRRLREAYRRAPQRLPEGMSAVFIARPRLNEAEFAQVRREVEELLGIIGGRAPVAGRRGGTKRETGAPGVVRD